MSSKPLFDQLRDASPLISVGILTANLMSLGSELKLMEEAGVKLLHVDVMDGCFCPMMTVGPGFIKAVKTPLLKDVHLMIEEPLDKLESYVAAGADMITVHVESCRHVHRVLQKLGEMTNANDPDRGILRGIALNPGTPLEVITPLIDELELVFLLAVNPGFSGQKLIPSTQERLRRLRQMLGEAKKDLLIGVDLKEHYTWNGEGTECNLVYIQGNSQEQETIDKVKEALGDRKVDFVFIDGDHTQAGVTNDYVNYGKLVSRGGTIGFHDINDGTGVKQFWSTIPQPKHEFNEGIGVGFILKESD